MYFLDGELSRGADSISTMPERPRGSLMDSIQRVLGSDFVDIYEQRGNSPFADVTLSKIVFMRLALDEPEFVVEGEPRYQLAVEATAHGVSAEDAKTGISSEKIDTFDGVRLKLLDNASNHSVSFRFGARTGGAEGLNRPSFGYDEYFFSRQPSHWPNLINRAYGMRFSRNVPDELKRSKVDDLSIITRTLSEGSLDKAVTNKLRALTKNDESVDWLNENPAAIKGSVPYFHELTSRALSSVIFLQADQNERRQTAASQIAISGPRTTGRQLH